MMTKTSDARRPASTRSHFHASTLWVLSILAATTVLGCLLLAVARAQTSSNVPHHVVVVDDYGEVSLTGFTVYVPGTTTEATIYADGALTLAMAQPITTSSTNTTMVGGRVRWYGPDGYDYKLTTTYLTQTNWDSESLNASHGTIRMARSLALDHELYALSQVDPNAGDALWWQTATTLTGSATSSFGRSLWDDANGPAALTTLGVSAYAQTLLDDANSAEALATLGASALDPNLTAIAGLTTAANKAIYWTGAGTAALYDLTAFARTVLDDPTAAMARTTLDLVIGDDVEAHDPNLTAIAGLTTAANKAIYWTGAGTAALYDLSAYMRTLLDDASEAAFKATVNLEIGVDVQAYDPNLALFAGLDPNAGDIPYFPSATTMSSTPTTSYTRGFLADANALEAWETLQGPYFNVLHYGATGDGVTDDSAAIQDAVNAAEDVNGVVVFPAGRYVIDSAITIDDDVTLLGMGAIIVSTGGYFSIQGSISGDVDLTDDVAAGDPNLTVASGDEAGFSAGDKILLHASALSNGQHQWWHERHIVRGTEDGEIQLEGHARFRYDLYGGEVGDPEESGDYSYQEPEVSLYSPIKVTIQGLKFEGSTTDYMFLDIDHCERLTIRDCEFYATAASRTDGYVWTCNFSQDILLDGCRFYDAPATAQGPYFSGCQNLKITNCEWFNNRARPLYIRFSQGVEVLGCTAFKNEGYIFTFEHSAEVDCSHNKIQWTPDSIVDFETSATSRPGIFIIGAQDVRIIGNQITDCHGEGAIYLRTGVYGYARDSSSAIRDDYIVVSNNIIRDLTNGMSTASIYAKSKGSYWTISNNILVTNENAIGLYGEYRYIDVFDNQIHNTTGNIGIFFGTNVSGGNEAGHIRIRRNRIYRDVYYGTNAYSIGVILDPDVDCEIADNEIWSLNSEDSAACILVARNASGAWGEANIRVTNNRILATNTASAQVGINFSSFTGYPDPGCVIIRDNDVNVPGLKYGTGADDYTIEEVTTLEVDEDDPNTFGLSKAFKTANTAPTTISDLGGALEGQEVTIIVNDGVTTFDFTSSGFEGRSADWTAEAGDVARFKYDGTQWYLLGILGTNAEYTVSNVTPDRAYDADSTSDAEIADVLGTLIADLKEAGIID